jgi:uncharacterized protein (DUF924 family)
MAIETVLEFWFGADPNDAISAKERAALWWSKDSKIDEQIRQAFERSVLSAAAGELSDWQSTPSGILDLILLTDQFPRNIYRDSPKAFAYDPKALAWCSEGIKMDFDLKLRPIERVFFYLPLEHAESLKHQEQSVKLFRELADSVAVERKSLFEGYLDFAVRHRDIIARFGRFPHRNKILGRESTPEELVFLSEPGSAF